MTDRKVRYVEVVPVAIGKWEVRGYNRMHDLMSVMSEHAFQWTAKRRALKRINAEVVVQHAPIELIVKGRDGKIKEKNTYPRSLDPDKYKG